MPSDSDSRTAAWFPAAGVRTQITLAALMWLVGASILLVRGVGYLSDRYWHSWALAIGLALGVAKAHLLLDRVARRAVDRIHRRGRAWLPGFFSLRSWGLVALMMGGGIALRQAIVHPGQIGAGILGAVYIGIGTALALADRVFWHALFRNGAQRPDPARNPAAETDR